MRFPTRGFTLVEIMVVVVILAIVSAIAIPMMSTDSLRVPSAARMVMSDLLFAQNSAVTTQKTMFVCFSNDKQAYTITYFTGTPPGTAPTFAAVKDGALADWKLLNQPTTQSRYMVQFGITGPDSPGPISRTKIKSIKIDDVEVALDTFKGFGFDSLGAPVDASGVAINKSIAITITNLADTVPEATLTISPITGEISVK